MYKIYLYQYYKKIEKYSIVCVEGRRGEETGMMKWDAVFFGGRRMLLSTYLHTDFFLYQEDFVEFR
jgi:hypothetical protein